MFLNILKQHHRERSKALSKPVRLFLQYACVCIFLYSLRYELELSVVSKHLPTEKESYQRLMTRA